MSDVIKFVNQLVDETSPPEDAPRLEMQEGGLVELRKILEKFRGKYPGLQLSIPIDTRKPTTPKIRINTEPQYKKFLEGKKKGFSINEIDELEKALSKYSKILSPKIAKSLEEKQKVLQEGRKKFAVKGKFGDRAEVKKQVNKIIEEIANGKRPLRDASRLFRGELIDTKLASKNFLTIDTRTKKPLYLSDKNFKILKEEIAPKLRSINARLKQGAASKEILEQLPNLTVNSFDSFYKKNPPIYNKLEIPRTLGDKVADMLNRHSVLGGNKFETISGNSFKDFKIKDLNKGDILTNEKIDNLIAKGDARFKEFKKVQNQVSKLKKTKYINPVSKKETTLFKALQEATGDIFPIHIDHIKGVKDEPLRFFQPLLSKTNIGKDAAMTVDELKKIGARRVLPGKQYAQGAVIDFKKQVNDLKKFADRKILQTAASGFEKPKRPSEILRAVPARDVVRKTTQS